jgi:hypothetical protein
VAPATAEAVAAVEGPPPDAAASVFTYRSTGSAVAIFWHGRQVKTVGGAVGAALRFKLASADEATAQSLLARASGDFKRGSERPR